MKLERANVLCLPLSCAVYVPSTMHGSQPARREDVDRVLTLVMDRMIELHGGCTVITTLGGYKLDNGTIVKEQVQIVRSAATAIDADQIIGLAELVAKLMDQESVAIELNGEVNLVSQPIAKAA